MDFLMFTLSCFIGFDTEFSCSNIATPRAADTYLECVVRGRQRVAELNGVLYVNQYGDQTVSICLSWERDKTLVEHYIPPRLTASQIETHTGQRLITVN
jgi:hypothetical protein